METSAANQLNDKVERPSDERGRGEAVRSIGTGYGSLAGACLLFVSVLATQPRPGVAERVAIACFATALPLLACTTVVAYTLALMPWPSAPTKQARRAVGATITLGLIGAMGVVIGLAALLWQLLPVAAVTFVGCSLLSLVAYSMLTMVSRPPHVVGHSPLS